MSRKRKQSKRTVAPAPVKAVEAEAVPEEILAEGSGPVEQAADADQLAEAANAVGRRRKKRRARGQTADSAETGSDQSAGGAEEASNGTGAASDGAASDGAAGDGAAAELDAAADLGAEEADRDAAAATDLGAAAADLGAAGDSTADVEADADVDAESAVATLDADAEADLDAGSVAEMEAAGGSEVAAEIDAAAAAAPDLEETADFTVDHDRIAGAAEDASAAVSEGDAAELAGEGGADGGEGLEGEAAGDEDGAEAGAVLPTSAASMDAVQLKHLVEALVFASDKPLTVARLRQLTRVSDTKRLEQALADITEDFRERGVILQQVSGGYQFRTRTQFSAWVQQLIAGRPVRLSRAQLETLAIIAYRQPITRPEIDEIRGVDSTATLKLLIDRALIRILGKKEEVGRPMLYGTTKEFLDFFSLGDLRELPTLREYSELTDESRQVMSARLGLDLDDSARAADGGDGGGDGGEGGDDGGSGGGDGGGSGDGSNGIGGGSPDLDSFDSGDMPSSNGVHVGASAHAGDVMADSEPSDDGDGWSADGSAVSETPDDVELAASTEEGESHVGAAEAVDAEAEPEAAPAEEAESHVGAAEAASVEEGESHVGTAETVDAGAELDAASAEAASVEEGESHVGAAETVDAGAEQDAASADAAS
ncbi:MAG TPA: SMC-Scp complex subunit ScpB, partial [Kofleriaceae bacterium]|nr:SMC-Scp complex subunit ScpB [Kofleriaceae bacterium]